MSRPLTPGRQGVPILQEAGWPPVPVWVDAENFAPNGIRSPNHPARSESPYRVSYPGQESISSIGVWHFARSASCRCDTFFLLSVGGLCCLHLHSLVSFHFSINDMKPPVTCRCLQAVSEEAANKHPSKQQQFWSCITDVYRRNNNLRNEPTRTLPNGIKTANKRGMNNRMEQGGYSRREKKE